MHPTALPAPRSLAANQLFLGAWLNTPLRSKLHFRPPTHLWRNHHTILNRQRRDYDTSQSRGVRQGSSKSCTGMDVTDRYSAS
jgi:hypothetical protein